MAGNARRTLLFSETAQNEATKKTVRAVATTHSVWLGPSTQGDLGRRGPAILPTSITKGIHMHNEQTRYNQRKPPLGACVKFASI